jgi:hypothetical protein
MIIDVDFAALFVALLPPLLVTAILQAFIIQPSVELLKRYYHKSRKHVKDTLFKNKDNDFNPVEPLLEK